MEQATRLPGPQITFPEPTPALARRMSKAADELQHIGEFEKARIMATGALNWHELMAEANPSLYLPDLAYSTFQLARMLLNAEQPGDARALAERAATLFARYESRLPEAEFHRLACESAAAACSRWEHGGTRQDCADDALRMSALYLELAEREPARYRDLAHLAVRIYQDLGGDSAHVRAFTGQPEETSREGEGR